MMTEVAAAADAAADDDDVCGRRRGGRRRWRKTETTRVTTDGDGDPIMSDSHPLRHCVSWRGVALTGWRSGDWLWYSECDVLGQACRKIIMAVAT